MTDAHCHVSCGDPGVRELIVGRDFFGVHPWETIDGTIETGGTTGTRILDELRSKLLANPRAGVGEIGLDRLKMRDIPPCMREVFEAQLALAFELNRPVVLHGAKCWGQVVAAIRKLTTNNSQLTTFLFHGFSRSDGLIPDIVKLSGFISVGPAVLNDHAVNCPVLIPAALPIAFHVADSVRHGLSEFVKRASTPCDAPHALEGKPKLADGLSGRGLN